jgi:oligopeptidase A
LTEAAKAKNGTILDPALGAHFRTEVLEVGASRPAMASFKAFRHRLPRIDALLREYGMLDND